MKTKKLQKVGVILCGLLMGAHAMAFDHGSMMGNGETLYPIRDGATPGSPIAATLDFKVVSIGEKTWIWTNVNGLNIAANSWSSQFRYWEPGKVENNLTGRVAGTQQTYGQASSSSLNPLTITFLQEEDNNFYETDDFQYDATALNSQDPSDTEAPVLETVIDENFTGTAVTLKLSATDNSGNYFYYIVDEENGISEVSFFDEVVVTGLLPETEYNLVVMAVDFSGNESIPQTVQLGATEMVSINSGIAKDIYFELTSTPTSLTVFCKPVDGSRTISDAFIWIAPIDGVLSEDLEYQPVVRN